MAKEHCQCDEFTFFVSNTYTLKAELQSEKVLSETERSCVHTSSFPEWLQWLQAVSGPRRQQCGTPGVGCHASPSRRSWAIFSCFPRCLIRKVDEERSTLDSHRMLMPQAMAEPMTGQHHVRMKDFRKGASMYSPCRHKIVTRALFRGLLACPRRYDNISRGQWRGMGNGGA